MSQINGILEERNKALNEENTSLREAMVKLDLFRKASDLKARDIIISGNKFGELFVVLRNNLKDGTDAIVCQVNDEGSEVVAIMPRKKHLIRSDGVGSPQASQREDR